MQSDKQLTSLATRELKKRRPFALGELLDLQNSLNLMREKYKSLVWYERKEMEQNAKIIKKRIKNQTTQYKIHSKKGLGEFGKSVVDEIF